ncbi:peptidoglycan lytic exotransglycosylase [Salmonella phage ST53]|nr:peptidoglycan lytic exotransglycosylase [Salmonella phage ST66]WJJ59459.1 peptidoglycan lytic exotransglycosylase [Salmonella phage ST64]WJJ59511.1 peptidoglycan lytic exotransglycosylase [Salmonella phage ST63]WJJ59611.1 peptidoglycan lytic exotransglycosylase [Salmonella phage ST59]WJJ59760.1 peptidoglycan lytic exotransglycosylase [Salmonella phage ST55]WJJ59764.1 peptidoglycan lytic exotransglycosylase [Salmonella phage ST53]
MATRGIRNNNPGNIRVSKDQWEGMTGDDGAFVTFDSPESGVRALGKNLLSYGRQGYDSIEKIINRWAPPNENDTQAYIDSVVAATGIPATQSLDLSDPDTLSSLAQAISFHETGSRYNPEVYQQGIARALNGISPKTPPVSANVFDALTEGLKAKPKVALGENLPTAAGLNIEGRAPEAPNESFGEMFYKATGETMQEREDRSTWFGFGAATEAEVKNSMVGVAIRAGQTEDSLDVIGDVFNPTRWNNHKWTREELDQIRNAGVLPQYYGVITGGSPQNLTELINLALENQKLDQEKAKAGTGAQLAAGVIGAGVDPLTYVPIAGQVGKGGKLVNKMFTVAAQSGALAGVSEMARTSVAGGDAHVAEAILGGALFGGGMTAIADGLGRALGRNTNEFAGPATRLEARETARNVDGQDLSRLPIQEGEQTFSHQGVKFADVPNEPGSVRLEDGSILIGENPLNPKTRQVFDEVIEPERAAAGVNLGGLTEIGLKLLRSENPEIRGVAADLVRSPTGMQSGASGKIGTTASDVFERLRAVDHRFYNDIDDAVTEALKDPYFQTAFWRDSGAFRQDIYQRVSMAIEDGSGNLKAELTPGELKVYDLLKNQFDAKREMMENPAMFGRPDAKSIFPGSRFKGTYVPHVYSRQVKELYIKELGSPEALQEAIKKSWLTSYASRPEVKKRVDEALLEADPTLTPEGLAAAVDKYANDKAYGISHTEQFERSSVMEENINGLVGLENNNFLEARNLFDSDMSIILPNGQPFNVNSLREWDMDKIVPAYNRRVNGDIAIMAGTGKTTKDMKDLVETLMNKAGDDGKLKGEVSTLRDTLKILTGRARRDGADDAAFATVMRTMTDLSFFAKNAYMGVQNLTEIGGMLARGNVRALLHGVPMFRDLAFRNKKVGASEIKDLHNVIFGKELDDSIRPSKQDVIDRLRSYSDLGRGAATALGTAKYYTGELAVRSPFTKVLNGTTNYLLDAGRQGFLSDIVEHSLTGSKRKFDDRWLKTAGISDEQWKGIKSLIRESVTRGPDGKYTIKDKKAFSQDPRAMDLWRMGDTIADETLLRPHKLSNMDAKAYGPIAKTVLQFKNFVIKSINGRTMRTFYNATKNNRAMDAALSTVMSMGLAGIYYMAQAHVKAYAMQDGRDRDYLKQALDPTMIGYAALSRSSHLGGPLGVANILGGIAGYEDTKMLRSSILPRSPTEKPERAIAYGAATSDPVMNVVGNFLEQVPAFGYAANVGASAYNLAGYLKADTRVNERDYMTGMYNTFRELVPNDPITQKLLLGTFEEQGIHIKD